MVEDIYKQRNHPRLSYYFLSFRVGNALCFERIFRISLCHEKYKLGEQVLERGEEGHVEVLLLVDVEHEVYELPDLGDAGVDVEHVSHRVRVAFLDDKHIVFSQLVLQSYTLQSYVRRCPGLESVFVDFGLTPIDFFVKRVLISIFIL